MDRKKRESIQKAEDRMLTDCIWLMRRYLGKLYDEELIRVMYFDDGDLAPWTISLGTIWGECHEWHGQTSDAAYAHFRNEFPKLAEHVKERLRA